MHSQEKLEQSKTSLFYLFPAEQLGLKTIYPCRSKILVSA